MSINQLISNDEKPWLNVKFNNVILKNIEALRVFTSDITTAQYRHSKSTPVINSSGNISPTFNINYIDTDSGVINLTLPSYFHVVKILLVNKGSNNFTINSSQLQGSLSYTIPPNGCITVFYDLNNWYEVSSSYNVSAV